MPELLHPGVYVQEVPSAVRPIEGVSTSTAAFIGVTDKGPLPGTKLPDGSVVQPTLITSFADYQRQFGGYRQDSFLTYAVQHFFDNGGRRCYIARIAVKAATASITLADREKPVQAERTLKISAANPGLWGNDVDVAILESTIDPDNEFKLVVKYRGETVKSFDNLSMDPTNENFVETLINGVSQYITVESVSSARTSAQGVLMSGDLDPHTLSVTLPASFKLQLDGDPTARDVTLTGTSSITTSSALAAAIQAAIQSLPPHDAHYDAAYAHATCEDLGFGDKFRLLIRSGSQGKDSQVVVTAGTANDVASTLKLLTSDGAEATAGVETYRGTSKSGNEPARSIDTTKNTLVININEDGPQTIVIAPPFDSGVKIAKAIQAGVRSPAVVPNDPAKKPAYDTFTVVYTDRYKLQFGNAATGAVTFTIDGNGVSSGLGIANKTASVDASKTATVENDHSMSADQEPARDLSTVPTPKLTLKLTGPDLTIDCPLTGDLTTGEQIAAAIERAVTTKAADPDTAKGDARQADIRTSLARFTCQYVSNYMLTVGSVPGGDPRDSSLRVTSAPANDAAAPLKLGRPNGGIEQNGSALLRPIASNGGDFHLGDHPSGLLVRDVVAGGDGTPAKDLKDLDFIGNAKDQSGLNALDTITDVNLITIPGQGSNQIVSAGMAYCNNRPLQDCFFIADLGKPPTQITTISDARNFVNSLPTKNDYGALYFPWVMAADPIGKGKNPQKLMPPSGFMAGVYARIDTSRGVFKAPAGTEANLAGVLDLAVKISDTDQDILNPIGINAIRSFPASGIVSWGARTLSSDSAWRYISVRRMAIFLRVSIYHGIQWAVFEPNDEPLWSSLRLNIRSFMLNLFRAGAFQGGKPDDAFFVKCDSSTTTQQDIDNGVVNILVGFAPLKPAEFVVLKLSQKVNQPAM